MQDNQVQVNFRMPATLRERLKEIALDNRRTMSAEIIFRLERAVFDPIEMKKGSEVSA